MTTTRAPPQFNLTGHFVNPVATDAVKRGAAALQFKAIVIAAVIIKPKAQEQQARD